LESGEILNLNWNRISILTKIIKLTENQKAEKDSRIALQNACAKNIEQRNKIVSEIKATINDNIVKEVKHYLKKK